MSSWILEEFVVGTDILNLASFCVLYPVLK